METLCNLFLGESHSSSSGCESEWAHYNLDRSPGKAVPRESAVQPPMGAGAWGELALCCVHTLATRSAPAAAQDNVTLSAAVPHLEVSACILHTFTRRRLISSSCKPEEVVLQIPSNTCKLKQHRWLTPLSRAPALRCNSLMVTGYIYLCSFCCSMMKTSHFSWYFFFLIFLNHCLRTSWTLVHRKLEAEGLFSAVGWGYAEKGVRED